MNSRNPENTRNIGHKDIDEIGVPKAEKETWAEVAERISADNAPHRTKTQTENDQ